MTPALVVLDFEMCVYYLFNSHHVCAGVNKFRSGPGMSLEDEMRRLCGPRWEVKTSIGSVSGVSLVEEAVPPKFFIGHPSTQSHRGHAQVMDLELERVPDSFEGVLEVIATLSFHGTHIMAVELAKMI